MNLESIRHQYEQAGLDIADVDPDPIVQFRTWFDEWAATGPRDPGVVVVSTVDASGWPSSRAVLLRGIDERGFVFYTNRTSTKGKALEATNRAAMSFVWHDLERQVHIIGSAEHVPEAESDAYLRAARGSQLGAWASDQSSVISSRETLDAAVREFSRDSPTRFRVHRTGAGISSVLTRSSSGRDARVAFTTAFATDSRVTTG